MKSKGFTLIELLAVIVILAIIALIATPIVLGIIEDSKQNANRISAGYMIDAVEKAYSMAYTKNMGAVPTKEAIAAEFDMSGATWTTDEEGNEVVKTTNGEVVCNVNVSGTSLSVSCEGFDNMQSETMEISSTTPESAA